MPPAVAAQNIGVGPCLGELLGDVLKAMARIAPSQPNEAMARIAPRSQIVPKIYSTQATCFLDKIRYCSMRFK
jgi:hypothetical protein